MTPTVTAASTRTPADLREPAFVRFLFHDARAAWIWLVVRLYLGYEWISAGWGKVTDPTWTGATSGSALTGFVNGAIGKATGAHPAVQGWYADLLKGWVVPNSALFAHVVAYGELLVGLALIMGALTGIAAFFGIVMNANYLLAGAVSTNPILALLAIFIVLAWRNAGWIGLDRWLLPLIGTPWQPGWLPAARRRTDRPGEGPGL
ncbi:MAG: DoxX family protein [Candidatus Limnocylindrales bacterium]